MATLPHYSQIKAAVAREEPVYNNLFDITFQLPASISNGEILTQSANSVTLPGGPEIGTVTQQYKYTKRTYLTFPQNTTFDTEIKFNVNLNETNSPYVFKKLMELYKLGFNPATGETSLKQDYSFTMTVDAHNKIGEIYRRVVFKDCIVKSVSTQSLSWADTDSIFEASLSVLANYWEDAIV